VLFATDLYVPDQFEPSSIQVTIIPGFYSDPELLKFTYDVTSFTKTSLELKLIFDDPRSIS
jgi:hypothetical protein